MHQVGLAEAHAAVQEERVVGMARTLGDRQAGGMGQAVGRPDDEVRERVARVDEGRPALAADPRRFEPDLPPPADAPEEVAAVVAGVDASDSAIVSVDEAMTNSTWTL
jgi:hypothetical protein